MARSKQIGNRNEREVANFFKLWTGWDFHKTPASGGLHWKKDYRVAGDIVCPADKISLFPFSVETKRRKQKVTKKRKLVREQINIGDLIINWMDSELWEFWEQCVRDAREVDREPIMFLKNSGMSKGLFYVFLYGGLARKLEKKFSISFLYIPRLNLAITNSFELWLYPRFALLFKFVRLNRSEIK